MGHPVRALARRAIADSSASRRRNDKNERGRAELNATLGPNWMPLWFRIAL